MCSIHLLQSVLRGLFDRQAVQGELRMSHPKRQLESGAGLGSGQEGMSAGYLCQGREKGGGREERPLSLKPYKRRRAQSGATLCAPSVTLS